MKTNELTGAALDWAVAKCELPKGWNDPEIVLGDETDYSTNWALGGAIIEREMIELVPISGALWEAYKKDQHIANDGATPLIAAMRCYVASKLGDEIEVPDEIVNYA